VRHRLLTTGWRLVVTLLAWALLMAVVPSGCGVPEQDHPEPVQVPTRPEGTPTPPQGGDATVTVYFVRNGRLTPVRRSAPDSTPRTALNLLTLGPKAAEASTGLETAIVAQRLTQKSATTRGVTIEASREFTSISGDNQLLAIAQVVWTVTENAPDRGVQFVVDGKFIELPTDQGLSLFAVRRGDYASLAPVTRSRSASPASARPK
jgi:hypothetical protein